MARVIKAGAGQKPARAPARVIVDSGGKKVIERAVYQAKQDAEHILRRAEEQRQQILQEGKRQAAQAREEAMARGASEAFAAAASEALLAFRRRAERYAQAADDIRAVALEVVKKVLGTEPDVGSADVEKVMQKGMAQLRARRRLRLQVGARRLAELGYERPNLMKALQSEPDLVIEGVGDVGAGFARVVTEIGGALCAEATALDALSSAVNVHEQPRVRPDRSRIEETQIAVAPSELEELRASLRSSPVRDGTAGRRAALLGATARHRAYVPGQKGVGTRDEFVAIAADDDAQETLRGTRSRIRLPSSKSVDGRDIRPGGRVSTPRARAEDSSSVPVSGSRPPRLSNRVMAIDASDDDDMTLSPAPLPRLKRPVSEIREDDFIEEEDDGDASSASFGGEVTGGFSSRGQASATGGEDAMDLFTDEAVRSRKKT